MTGQAMHASIDLGFHKLIIVPPAYLMIAVQWLPKSQDLLPSTKSHSSSQNHIRRVVPSRIWAVGLLPESFWDRNGHGLWVFYHISPFPMRLGFFQWPLSCYAEVCCLNSIRIHSFRWNGGLRWVGNAGAVWKWKTSCLYHVWEDGSYCSSLY